MSSTNDSSEKWIIVNCPSFYGLWAWVVERSSEISKSTVEVIATILFTFVPFIFLSIKWTQSAGANTQGGFADAFMAFWQSGEIALPIYGLCGAVSAVLALNKGYFSWWVHAAVSFMLLIVTLGAGAALMGSSGFNVPLNQEVVTYGFLGYSILVFVWFLLTVRVRTTKIGPRASDRNARGILDEANERRKNAGLKS